MKYSMKLLEKPFKSIKDGSKTVEFRLYDEKRKQIKIGDTIEFSLLPDLKEKILTEVVDLYHANTLKELFENIYQNKKALVKNNLENMYAIYSKNLWSFRYQNKINIGGNLC